MKITTPTRWGEGWGMDEDGIPFRLIDGKWVEQTPIGVVLEKPRRYPAEAPTVPAKSVG